jgi:hypothetical protein
MQPRVTPEQWADLLYYRREYAKEVLLSRSPASIEHSDPGKYEWQSPEIAARVQRRFAEYGPADALYAQTQTRHLIRLTVPQQRLSKVLERSTPDDVEQCELRLAMFDERRNEEEKHDESIIRSVRHRLSSIMITPLSLRSALMDLVRLRAELPAEDAGNGRAATGSDRLTLSLAKGIQCPSKSRRKLRALAPDEQGRSSASSNA